MTGLETLTFSAPLALLGLFLLPVIWWLSRLTPPRARKQFFPAARLLDGLDNTRQQADRHPLVLLLMRLLAFALLILAFSGPLIEEQKLFESDDPVLIVLEDGFASARNWPRQMALLDQALLAARARNLPVSLIGTTRQIPDHDILFVEQTGGEDLRRRLPGLTPKAWPSDFPETLLRLQQATWQGNYQTLWLEDGQEDTGEQALLDYLTRKGPIRNSPVTMPLTSITGVSRQPNYLQVTLEQSNSPGPAATSDGPWLRMNAAGGQILSRQQASFNTLTGPANQTTIRFTLPPEVLNKARRISVEGQSGAQSVYYLDSRHQRNSVMIIASSQAQQPLLNETHYLTSALATSMDIDIASPIDARPDSNPGMILLTDQGSLPAQLQDILTAYMQRGGIMVRFAGPKLSADEDPWLPVPLRRGSRAIGSTLSWDRPVALGSFEENGPFFGLPVPPDIRIRQQVLADPSGLGDSEIWARLVDGTPLITARREGSGWFVLFHVEARADWSNLPLSGLFVSLLRRLSDLSALATAEDADSHANISNSRDGTKDADTNLALYNAINGFGRLAGQTGQAVSLNRNAAFQPSSHSPPGLYGPAGQRRAFNLGPGLDNLLPANPALAPYRMKLDQTRLVTSLTLPLVIAGLVVLLAEMMFSLFFMRGGAATGFWPVLRQLVRPAGNGSRMPLAIVGMCVALFAAPDAQVLAEEVIIENGRLRQYDSQTAKLRDAVLETRLGYIRTGIQSLDQKSEAGLLGLSQILIRRTSVEPAAPVGLDPDLDELRLYPLIYWPVTENSPMPNPVALDNLRQYAAIGGTLVFDTQDALGEVFAGASPARRKLARILQQLDVPPLTRIPEDHILTRAFYLLQAFPGRYDNGQVWVESEGEITFDGVSRFVIGAQDWAGAWAIDNNGIPLHAIPAGATRGGPDRRREMALRFGVNLVMYVLTGNYKADQVHVPAILERLGQ